MLRYPCLVLDHDDTVVQSEKTTAYPCFCESLKKFRPGMTISYRDYIYDCHDHGFVGMCRRRFQFTDEELHEEYKDWMEYIKTHIPAPFPGIGDVIRRQKQEGGLVCVVSHSSIQNITRDYDVHFGVQPDAIYSWDLPEHQRKPNPWALQQIMDTYHLSAEQLLVVDDMKAAVGMARAGGCKIAFAGWGRADFPQIYEEMSNLCDFSFDSIEKFEKFLFH